MKKSLLQEGARTKGRVEPDHWWDKQHSLVLRQTPRWAQFFVLGLVILSSGAIIASSIIKIDEVITVQGKLVPKSGSYEVKTPAGGLVEEVLAGDGDYVRRGEIVVVFDTRRAAEELKTLDKQTKELELTLGSQLRTLEKRRKVYERKYKTNKKIFERLKILRDNGAMEQNTILQKEDQLLELQTQIIEVDEQILQTKSQYSQRLDNINSSIFANKIQLQYETVRAAKDGIIFESVAAPKGVLQAGQTIMKIVPQDKLKADVMVTNKDIGYIKEGQKARIRIDAFDYTEFGQIEGNIKSIGADVLPPDQSLSEFKYPVIIELERNYLIRDEQKIPVRTGMAITANIKLREKRLISIVSDIFSDNKDAINQLRQ